MNFKEYTYLLKEAKFREQSEQLVDNVKKMAQIYFDKFKTSPERSVNDLYKKKVVSYIKDEPHWGPVFKKMLNKGDGVPQYFESLGKITIFDKQSNKNKKVPFIVVYKTKSSSFALYSPDFDIVVLFDDNLNDVSLMRVEQIVLHELTHAFQEYRTQSDAYTKNAGKEGEKFKKDVYYKEPIEFDSHLNEIAYIIRQQYKVLNEGIKKARDPIAKRVLENRLEKFLLELSLFITSPSNVYFDFEELPVPSFIEAHGDFVKTISSDNKKWMTFKQKMEDLYRELTGKDVRGREIKKDPLVR